MSAKFPRGGGYDHLADSLYVEANVMNTYVKFQLHSPYGFWGEDFWIFFFENLPFMLPWQPIKFSDLDNIHMNCIGLWRNISVKKNVNSCSETAKIASFHFSHYKSMKTISSYPIGTKYIIIHSPGLQMLYVKSGKNRLHGFRDVVWKCWRTTDGRRTDGRQMLAYTISSPMSLRLRWAKKVEASLMYEKICYNLGPSIAKYYLYCESKLNFWKGKFKTDIFSLVMKTVWQSHLNFGTETWPYYHCNYQDTFPPIGALRNRCAVWYIRSSKQDSSLAFLSSLLKVP